MGCLPSEAVQLVCSVTLVSQVKTATHGATLRGREKKKAAASPVDCTYRSGHHAASYKTRTHEHADDTKHALQWSSHISKPTYILTLSSAVSTESQESKLNDQKEMILWPTWRRQSPGGKCRHMPLFPSLLFWRHPRIVVT